MKKLFSVAAICALTLMGATAQAKIKVVEKSTKNAPTWVGGVQSEYIIVSATAPTLDAAKADCMEQVRRQIIRSVAENVESASTSTIDQQVMNNEIVSFIDSYSSVYKTQSADVPFLAGVSESKAEAYYWEKREDKKTKESVYVYSVKYPLPSLELKKLVNEFNKKDSQMWQGYLELEKGYDNVASLEDIDRAIADLGRLADYFFDKTRKSAAITLQKNYRSLYNGVSFKTVSDKLGEYRFKLVLNGRDIATSQRLTAKSNNEMRYDVEHDNGRIVVKYNVAGAEYDVENTVTVNVKIGGRMVPHKFAYTVRKTGLKIWPDKTVYLTAEHKSDSLLTNIDVRMHVVSQNGVEFVVNSILLEVPGVAEPLFIDNINQKITKREQTLAFTYIGTTEPLETQYSKLNMLRGYMTVEVPSQGIDTRIDFSLPFKANW